MWCAFAEIAHRSLRIPCRQTTTISPHQQPRQSGTRNQQRPQAGARGPLSSDPVHVRDGACYLIVISLSSSMAGSFSSTGNSGGRNVGSRPEDTSATTLATFSSFLQCSGRGTLELSGCESTLFGRLRSRAARLCCHGHSKNRSSRAQRPEVPFPIENLPWIPARPSRTPLSRRFAFIALFPTIQADAFRLTTMPRVKSGYWIVLDTSGPLPWGLGCGGA